jgi:hypothetical protein
VQLKHYLDGTYPERSSQRIDKSWERLQSHAKTAVDADGRPILQVQVGSEQVRVGASADNVLNGSAPPHLVRQLLEARLEAELRRSPRHGISETEVARDWDLLQKTIAESDPHLTARSGPRSERSSGNQP